MVRKLTATLLGVLVVGAGLTGCACNDEPAPAPEPAKPAAKQAEPAKPAPAPAPGDVMYLPTGDRATSALSVRCGMPREVFANNNFTYDIEVCNLTSLNLSNVMVTHSLEGARIVSSDVQGGGGGFAVGDLAPRACKTIRVTANAGGSGAVRACSGATWQNSICCSTNIVNPQLKITKSVTPGEITPCDMVTYTIEVTNTGTGAATNVRVTDNLPQGVTTADGKNTWNWDVGTLAAGQTQRRTFTAKPTAKSGSFANSASAAADNNLSAKSGDVTFVVKQPVLAITKVCPQTVRLGRPATFEVTVTNNGDAVARSTVVEDTLPAGSTVVSASDGGTAAGGKVTWNVGDLAPKASRKLTLTLNLASAVGSIQNSASARAVCADPVSANCSTGVVGAPDLATLVTDDNVDIVLVGDNQTYRVEVKNQGQIPLTNVKMVVTLPDGLAFVSSANATAAGNKVTFNIGTIGVGKAFNGSFVAKASSAGEKLLIGETTCTEIKTPVRDDELTNFVDR
ncbi:MAG: CARDB domain-containing protein [Phycisphaerales bacterium]